MAGKHQIWSSNKRTRQRANRCWRRQNKERLRNEAREDPNKIAPQGGDGLAHKRGGLVHGDPKTFGLTLGDLISTARQDAAKRQEQDCTDVTADQFTHMIARWSQCTLDDFRTVMSGHPEDLLLDEFQKFELTPLEFFLTLTPQTREKWVRHFLG